jgi:hypothetical protein
VTDILPADMAERRSRWRYPGLAALLSPVLAELGHQLGFVERYGARGVALEGAGVHHYFPTLLTVVGAGLGASALGTLLVLALGRLAVGGALGRTRRPGVAVRYLLPTLVALQLAVYVVQESAEALAIGQELTFSWLLSIVFWGLAGQAPLALLAALALSWLSARLDRALAAIREVVWAARVLATAPVARPPAGFVPRTAHLPLALICGMALSRRGPPLLPRPLLAR